MLYLESASARLHLLIVPFLGWLKDNQLLNQLQILDKNFLIASQTK